MHKTILLSSWMILGLFITTSLVPTFTIDTDTQHNGNKDLVLITLTDPNTTNLLTSLDASIIETYDHNVLVQIESSLIPQLQKNDVSFRKMHHQNTLYINEYRVTVPNDERDIPFELRIEEYQSNQPGLYILNMIGPIKSDWRHTLETMGVEVVNYIPTYAYLVWMTPEQAEAVLDLSFVNWVGIYQPYYKLQSNVTPGIVSIELISDANLKNLTHILEEIELISFVDTSNGYRFIGKVHSQETLYELANIKEVCYIFQNRESVLHSELDSQIIGGGAWIMDDDNNSSTPYRVHGDFGAYINQLGYTGEGVVIAIADTGLGDGTIDNASHCDFNGKVLGGYYWSGSGWQDGHGHGTHCAGSIAGNTSGGTGVTYAGHGPYYVGQGLAYESELYAVKIFSDSGEWIGPGDYFKIVEVPKQEADAYVHSNSWGYKSAIGTYASADHIYDRAVRDADGINPGNQPMVITVSAGNNGSSYQTIGSPGNAKNVITVGATESYMPDAGSYGYQDHINYFGVTPDNPDNIIHFSSRGWTADNRVKPDVVAPGYGILSTLTPLKSNGNYTEDNRYEWMQGTSMSNPAVAGAAAVTVQWYEENHDSRPSPAMVKALLINTAHDLNNTNGNTDPIPNRDEGWGMVDISKLQYPHDNPVPFYLYDQEHIFNDSGQIKEHVIMVDRDGVPLKISLVWTDKEAPSGTGSGRTLVNDLNLEVESPSGLLYRGNAFVDGWTKNDTDTMSDFDNSSDGWDDTNNVENVYIHQDDIEIGIYTVRVMADNIADDAVNLGNNSQDYALVAYNARKPYVPDPPPVFTSTPINRTAIMLSWIKSKTNLTYIEYNLTGDPWSRGEGTIIQNSTNTTCNHTQLYPGITYYYQAWSYNITDNSYSETFISSNTTTIKNTLSVITNETPSHESTDNDVFLPRVQVNISDADGDLMDWTIDVSTGDTASGKEGDGLISCDLTLPLNYSETITWFVNVTDGFNWTNKSYSFQVRDEWIPSKPTNFSAFPENRFQINLSWVKGDFADYTYIECDGVEIYNGTGTSFAHTGLLPGTLYSYEAWSINVTDGVWSNTSFFADAMTDVNHAPELSNVTPINGSTAQELSFTWNVTIQDPEGDTFNWSIECSTGENNSETDGSNGTKSLVLSALDYGLEYLVWVNATDEYGAKIREWFTFTTKDEPWMNTCPMSSNEHPVNGSKKVNIDVGFWSVFISDDDGNTTVGSIVCSNGASMVWTSQGNSTQTLSLGILEYTTNYTIWLNVTDGHCVVNESFWFVTSSKPTPTTPKSSKTPRGVIPIITIIAPTANATVDKTTGDPGELFTFNASESKRGDNDIKKYTWDFDDGTIKSTNKTTITHSFNSTGLFDVMLTVEDEQGEKDSLDAPLIIKIIKVNNPPVNLTVTAETTQAHQNTTITLTMSAIDPDQDDMVRFDIDWGDGTQIVTAYGESGKECTMSHQWETYGVYLVTVTAFDTQNASTDPFTMNMYVDVIVIDDEITGWLIDTNSDTWFDVFRNTRTGEETRVLIQEEGSYLIDSTNDGTWEYRYCATEGLKENREKMSTETPGLPMSLIVLSLVVYLILWKKKNR